MTAPATPESPSAASLLLRRFARRRSRILLLRGLAAAVLTLVAALVVIAMVDRRFLLDPTLRALLSAAAYLAALAAFFLAGGGRWLLALLRPTRDIESARMLRSVQAQSGDVVRSAIELRAYGNGSAAFINEVEREADATAGDVRVERVLPSRLYLWRTVAAVAVVAGIVSLIVLPPLRHWQVGRMVGRALLPAADIPRASPWDITLLETPTHAALREDVIISARVEALFGGEPDVVELEVRPERGPERRLPMERGDDGLYHATLQLDQAATLRAWADRGTSARRRIEASARPTLLAVEGEFTPPPYLSDAPPAPVQGERLAALAGSLAEVVLVFSEPVADATLADQPGQAEAGDSRRVRWQVPIEQAASLPVAAVSARTGLALPPRAPLTVMPLPDNAPIVEAQSLDEATLTPESIALFTASARDDVRLAFALPEWRIGRGEWTSPDATALQSDGFAGDWPIDLKALDARAGDVVEVRLRVVDAAGQEAVGESVQRAVSAGGLPREALAYLRAAREFAQAVDGSEGRYVAALALLDAAPSARAAFEAAAAADSAALPAPPQVLSDYATELARAQEVEAAATLLAAAADEAAAVAVQAADFNLDDLALSRARRRQAGAVSLADQALEHVRAAEETLPLNAPLRQVLRRTAEPANRAIARPADDNRLLSANDAARFSRELSAATEHAVRALQEAQKRMDDLRPAVDSETVDGVVAALDEPDGGVRTVEDLAVVALRRPDTVRAQASELADLVLLRRVAREWPTVDDDRKPAAADAMKVLLVGRRLAHLAPLNAGASTNRDEGAVVAAIDRLAGETLLHDFPADVARSLRRARRDRAELGVANEHAAATLDAARQTLRALLPDVTQAAADVIESDEDWQAKVDRLADALRDDATAQPLNDAAARERARDADAAVAALDAAADQAEAQRIAEQVREHFERLDRGHSVEETRRALRQDEADAAAREHEKLSRLAEAAGADPAEAARQMREEAARDPAARRELEQLANAAEREAADDLADAAAAESQVADELEQASERLRTAQERGDAGDPVEVEQARQALEQLRRRAGAMVQAAADKPDQQPTVDAAESLADAANALANPESPDPATAADAVREAADQMAEAAQSAAAQAEQAAQRAQQSAQQASDALDRSEDYATPYQQYQQAKQEAEQASQRAAAAGEAARRADELATQLDAEAQRPAAAEAAMEQRQAEAAVEQQAIQQQAKEAAEQLEQAAALRRELQQEAEANAAESAAEQAREAADQEVGQAQQAATSGTSEEAADAATQAQQSLQRAAEQAQANAESSGGESEGGNNGSPSQAVAQAVSQLAQGSPEGAANAMQEAAQRQADAMQRKRAAPPGPPTGPPTAGGKMPSQMPGSIPSPLPGDESSPDAQGGTAQGVGPLGNRPEGLDDGWAKLAGRGDADVSEGRRPDVPSEYADLVEAYYRALARRAKRPAAQP